MANSNDKVIEVEHENLILGKKLIDMYEERIKALENEVNELKLKIYQPPVKSYPVPHKHRLRTTSELIRALELRSLRSIGKVEDEKVQ